MNRPSTVTDIEPSRLTERVEIVTHEATKHRTTSGVLDTRLVSLIVEGTLIIFVEFEEKTLLHLKELEAIPKRGVGPDDNIGV